MESNLPEKVRDSLELSKVAVCAEMQEAKQETDLETLKRPEKQKPASTLVSALSGVSPAELALVERSQDSLQVTKKRMERSEQARASASIDSDASCDTSESQRTVCHSNQQSKKAKTRFFIAGQTSVPAHPGRKSVGRRITEAFGIKGTKSKDAEDTKSGEMEGHVKFNKFPEIID